MNNLQPIEKFEDNIAVLKNIISTKLYSNIEKNKKELNKIVINLGEKSYDIILDTDNLKSIGDKIRSLNICDAVIIITSPRIGKLYADSVIKSLKAANFRDIAIEKIPDGEINKSFENYKKLLQKVNKFDEKLLSKKLLIVNLGGGVVGDVGGFVAATFKRGINYIQIPTTLLAFVDCGIGGKVGVNFANAKNLIGNFYQPKLVYGDLTVLKTLSKRELLSGLAEVIKYSVICDPNLFLFIEKNYQDILNFDLEKIKTIVYKSYLIKSKIVENDEKDNKNIRVVLNYGHTIGHAIEGATNYSKYTHGEAIAIGMICAAELANKMKMIDIDDVNKIENLVTKIGYPTTIEGCTLRAIMESLVQDKKFINGKMRFVLPTQIGRVVVVEGIKQKIVEEIISNRLK